jgi:hypothetical protein
MITHDIQAAARFSPFGYLLVRNGNGYGRGYGSGSGYGYGYGNGYGNGFGYDYL